MPLILLHLHDPVCAKIAKRWPHIKIESGLQQVQLTLPQHRHFWHQKRRLTQSVAVAGESQLLSEGRGLGIPCSPCMSQTADSRTIHGTPWGRSETCEDGDRTSREWHARPKDPHRRGRV